MKLSTRARTVASVSALAVVMTLLSSKDAFAEDPSTCIQAYEQTQNLRRAGKLRDARTEAAKCAAESCPAVLARDCTKWLGEIDQSIPTVVFEVKSAAGDELTNVKVTVDGKPLVDKLDGKSVAIDVGQHVFRFEGGDGKSAPVEQKAVVHEGEKNKKISVTLGSKNPIAATPPAGGERPIPPMAFVFGGVGIVSLGVGTFFAVSGASKESDLDACKPSCSADRVNSVSTSYAFADVLLTAGVVSLVAAAYIYLTRPTVLPSNTARLGPPSQSPRGFVWQF